MAKNNKANGIELPAREKQDRQLHGSEGSRKARSEPDAHRSHRERRAGEKRGEAGILGPDGPPAGTCGKDKMPGVQSRQRQSQRPVLGGAS